MQARALIIVTAVVLLGCGPATGERGVVVTPTPFDALVPTDHTSRHALVVGNESYLKGPLRNPISDAKGVGRSLRRLGFDSVTVVTDVDKKALRSAVSTFVESLPDDSVAVFFYAGHGVEIDGENLLLPVDFSADNRADALDDGYKVSTLLKRLNERENPLNIVVFDACRDDPYSRAWSRGGGAGGFSEVDAPIGNYIAYSTAPGDVALDGFGADNSPFSAALMHHIDTAGLELDIVFRRVRLDVNSATDRRQVPWSSNNLISEFYFAGAPVAAAAAPVQERASLPSIQSGTLYDLQPIDLVRALPAARRGEGARTAIRRAVAGAGSELIQCGGSAGIETTLWFRVDSSGQISEASASGLGDTCVLEAMRRAAPQSGWPVTDLEMTLRVTSSPVEPTIRLLTQIDFEGGQVGAASSPRPNAGSESSETASEPPRRARERLEELDFLDVAVTRAGLSLQECPIAEPGEAMDLIATIAPDGSLSRVEAEAGHLSEAGAECIRTHLSLPPSAESRQIAFQMVGPVEEPELAEAPSGDRPRILIGKVELSGRLGAATIRRFIGKRNRALAACYERELLAGDVSGQVRVRFAIDVASGRTTATEIVANETGRESLGVCVDEVFGSIAYPPVKGSGIVSVVYPINFERSTEP